MSFLIPALEGSKLAGPLVRLSRVSTSRLDSILSRSRTAAGFQKGVRKVQEMFDWPLLSQMTALVNRFSVFHENGILLGCLLLLVLFATAGTTVMGVFTTLLFLYTLKFLMIKKKALFEQLTLIDCLVLLFFATAILSTAFSSYVHTSVIGLAKMLVFFEGYFVFRTLFTHYRSLQERKAMFILLGGLVLLGAVQCAFGFYQYINHVQPLATWQDPTINPELQLTRIFGTLKPYNPNLLAGFLAPCLGLAFGFLFLGFFQTSALRRWVTVVFGIGLCLGLLVAIALTGSRGGFLALAGMLPVVFLYGGHLLWHEESLRYRNRLKALWLVILLLGVLSVGAAIAGSEKLRNRITSIGAMRNDSSISYRLNVYQSASKIVAHNPVIGIGPGNETFKLVYGLYMVPGYNALGSYSVPLEIAVEQGAIGLAAFFLLCLVMLIRFCLCVDSRIALSDKILVGGIFLGIWGSFLYGIFDTIWYRPAVNLTWWMLVAAFSVTSEQGLKALEKEALGKRS